MLKLMQIFTGLKGLPTGADAAARFADSNVPYVEVDTAEDTD